MTLKEQIKPYMYCYLGSGMLTNTYNKEVVDKYAQEVEKISDEFTIGFAEWLGLNNYKFSLKYKSYQKNHINETMFYDAKKLLEIYKKEKGL